MKQITKEDVEIAGGLYKKALDNLSAVNHMINRIEGPTDNDKARMYKVAAKAVTAAREASICLKSACDDWGDG